MVAGPPQARVVGCVWGPCILCGKDVRFGAFLPVISFSWGFLFAFAVGSLYFELEWAMTRGFFFVRLA